MLRTGSLEEHVGKKQVRLPVEVACPMWRLCLLKRAYASCVLCCTRALGVLRGHAMLYEGLCLQWAQFTCISFVGNRESWELVSLQMEVKAPLPGGVRGDSWLNQIKTNRKWSVIYWSVPTCQAVWRALYVYWIFISLQLLCINPFLQTRPFKLKAFK